jgi:hypothetical protein
MKRERERKKEKKRKEAQKIAQAGDATGVNLAEIFCVTRLLTFTCKLD